MLFYSFAFGSFSQTPTQKVCEMFTQNMFTKPVSIITKTLVFSNFLIVVAEHKQWEWEADKNNKM